MPKIPNTPKLVNRGPAGLLAKSPANGQPVPAATDVAALLATAPKDRISKDLCKLPLVQLSKLVHDPNNARLHPERNLESIKVSLALYGQRSNLTVNRRTMHVEKGNGTLQAARELGWTKLAVSFEDDDEATAAGYGLADNRTAELARWDFEVVARLEKLMAEASQAPVGWTSEEILALRAMSEPPPVTAPTLSLSERFIIPPFSVLDARQGYWQARKKAWLALGIQSELGRGEDLQAHNLATAEEAGSKGLSAELKARIDRQQGNGLLGFSEQAHSHYRANAAPGGSPRPAASLGADGKTRRGDGAGRPFARTKGSGGPGDLAAGFQAKTLGAIPPNERSSIDRSGSYAQAAIKDHSWVAEMQAQGVLGGGLAAAQSQSGTSIFDPVLCELVYRWFSPPAGQVLDPFAGGSVRGIVAAMLGLGYVGIDLRPEQAAANEEQAAQICPASAPTWRVGDALNVQKLCKGKYDLLFSCPPYGSLERYSDDPRDLSTMEHPEFLHLYGQIITASCALLRPNRFACFVVGDIRDKKGIYRNFVSDTTAAFQAAGLQLYNDAVLVTAVGSLPIRVGKQFAGGRKLGKTHQNVLVYIKGSAHKAVHDCGPVEVVDLEAMFKDQLGEE